MEVAGFTAANGISYNIDGSLQSLTYANGAAAVYGCDQNRRLDQLKVIVAGVERRFNRLIEVTKNGNIVVANYVYDPEGFRVVKKAKGETNHYVFQGREPIFEKRITAGKSKSYVYALGKYLARVDGVIGDPEAKKYFYHTDHAGSIRVITDQAGEVVYKADYFAFGTQFAKDGDFEELHGFTGKEYDPDIGLYYYNARWHDPDLGRFISEDPAVDPNNPNLYSYCGNNPVIRIDPTGEVYQFFVYWIVNALRTASAVKNNGGDLLKGFWWGLWGNPTFTFSGTYGDGEVHMWSEDQESGGRIQYPREEYSGDYGSDYYFGYEPIPYPDYVITEFEEDIAPLKVTQSKRSTVVNPKKQVQVRSRAVTAENLVYQSSTVTKNNYDAVLDGVQLGLDLIGLWPGMELADALNGCISLYRGDKVAAGLSFAATIPFAGWGATGGKFIFKYGDEAAAGSKTIGKFVNDFPTKNTKQWSAVFKSEGQARQIARQKLGKNPIQVEPGKLRSQNGKWQYRAKPGDLGDNHIHLEEINPITGEVIQNLHLRW